MCGGGNPFDAVGDFFEDTVDFATDTFEDAIDFAGDVIETVGDVAENILENPMPVIQTIALTAALGPSGLALATTTAGAAAIAGAAMAAMNGGDIKEIAIAAGTSYLGSEIGRVAGAQVGTNTAIQAMDKATQETIKQVVTSASGNAAVVALKGGSLEDVLKAGTTAAVGGYVNGTLVRQYGFDPKALDTQLITNSTAAATRAVLNGKSITEAVANTAAVSALALTISGTVDKVKSSDAAYQKVYNDFNALKEKANTWAQENLVDRETRVNQAYERLRDSSEGYDKLRRDYDAKYAEWQKYKNANDSGNANRLAKELNAMAEQSKVLGETVEKQFNQYQTFLKQYEDKYGIYEIEYLNKLNAMGQEAQRIAEEQQRLSATLGQDIAKYEQEAALAEKVLGEKIKIKAMEQVKYDYYIKENVSALKELGYSDAEAKQIADDFYETEVSYQASKLKDNVGQFVKDYANLSKLNPVASDFVDELIAEGKTAQDALKTAKDAADVVSYENAKARGENEWTDSNGVKNILIKGVGGAEVATPVPKVDEAVKRIGGLFGLGTPDPNAAFTALFGGATGSLSIPGLWGSGTAQQKQQAITFVDEVINNPTSTPTEKAEAEKLKEKIKTEEQMSLKKSADRKAAEKEVSLAGQKAAQAENEFKQLTERAIALQGAPEFYDTLKQAREAKARYEKSLDELKVVENKYTEVIKNDPVATDAFKEIKSSQTPYDKPNTEVRLSDIERQNQVKLDLANWQRIYDEGVAKENAMLMAKAEQERQAILKAEADRQAAIQAEQQRQAEIVEFQRQAAIKAEQDRQAAIVAEEQRQAQLRAEQERQAALAEQQRQVAIKAEQDRLAAEQQRLEQERIRAEQERQEAERQAAIRAEQERVAAEQRRLEAQKQEADRQAAANAARAQEEADTAFKLAAEDVRNKAEQELRAKEEAARVATVGTGTNTGTVGGDTGTTTGGGAGTQTGGGTGATGGEGTGTGGTDTGGTGAGSGGTGTGSGTGGEGTGGGGTGGTGSGSGTGLPKINLPRTAGFLSYLALLNKARDQGPGYQFALPDLLASREALQKSPTGEFVTPVEYTYRSTGEPYVPGQFTPPAPPAAPTTQAAQGGLMLDFDPTNSVKLYQAGGEVDSGQIYRLAQSAGLGTDNDTLNALMKYMSQGMSPQEAADYVYRLQSKARSTKQPDQIKRNTDNQGLMGLAKGGNLPPRYLNGGTDGMADQIPAKIGANQPAALSHGEFVIPADVVSHLGNGNSEAGANVLYDMMARIRKARTGTTKQGKQINPKKFMPKG